MNSCPEESAPADRPACRECLGSLAHRLSQTLTVLRGTLELALLGERTAAAYRAALEQALPLADQFVQLLDSLRDLAESLGSGGRCEAVPLYPLVEETVEAWRGWAESRGLDIALAPGREIQAWAHPEKLRLALHKTLYSLFLRSAGDGTIAIAVSRSGDTACLTFSDPRPGEAQMEPGPRRPPTNPGSLFSAAAQGSNLEGMIAQRLVEAMGGNFQVENDASGGCSVRLALPLRAQASTSEDGGERVLPRSRNSPTRESASSRRRLPD